MLRLLPSPEQRHWRMVKRANLEILKEGTAAPAVSAPEAAVAAAPVAAAATPKVPPFKAAAPAAPRPKALFKAAGAAPPSPTPKAWTSEGVPFFLDQECQNTHGENEELHVFEDFLMGVM